MQVNKHTSERFNLALKPRVDINSRGPGGIYQWPYKNDLCPRKLKNSLAAQSVTSAKVRTEDKENSLYLA